MPHSDRHRRLPLAAGLLALASCSTHRAENGPQIYPVLSEPSHRTMFSNAQITAFEVRLRPGKQTYFHKHAKDLLSLHTRSVVVEDQRLGAAGQVVARSEGALSYTPYSAEGEMTHRVQALQGEMWVVAIEFKNPAPAGSRSFIANPNDALITVPQATIKRVALLPGMKVQTAAEILVAKRSGALRINGSGQIWDSDEPRLIWLGREGAELVNQGDHSVDLLLVDLQ